MVFLVGSTGSILFPQLHERFAQQILPWPVFRIDGRCGGGIEPDAPNQIIRGGLCEEGIASGKKGVAQGLVLREFCPVSSLYDVGAVFVPDIVCKAFDAPSKVFAGL